ncbi:MAG: AAA family ATPase [Chitinophagaceae bacterium]|nr:MAG: AAA family ATPase [Chitinophagaceae bacterium]
MKVQNAAAVYNLYDRFIDECLLQDDSILTQETNICTLTNFEEVKRRFIDGGIEGSDSNYWQKITEQFKGASYEVKLCFAHFNWLWSLAANDITVPTKRDTPKWILDIDDATKPFKDRLKNDYYPKDGVGSAGQYHKTNKPFEINFLILLGIDIKRKLSAGQLHNAQEIKDFIVSLCIDLLYSDIYANSDYVKFTKGQAIAMHNILLHLTEPDYYEPIAAERDKNNIITAFYHLVQPNDEDSFRQNQNKAAEYELNREDKIYLIRVVLAALMGNNAFSFYDYNIKTVWNYGGANKTFSSLQALMFKKAIILFGPPGTGKTYEAQQLASALISQYYIHIPTRLSTILTAGNNVVSKRVHEFQFNPNTSYEEFIVGYEIVQQSTQVKRGKLLDIIDAANNETEFVDADKKVKMPHVVILDEINRVDLSRVFGEVLSLLEYRNKIIPTAVSTVNISIPDNLYFIGTMNEIDFSLERLDFALRRRFVWLPVLFDKEALYQMLENRLSALRLRFREDELQEFVNRCSALNDYITYTRKEELGEKFQIGHAFFTDIADILYQQKALSEYNVGLLKKKTVAVLWEISIGPLLDAYLGNIDADLKNTYLTEAKALFVK